MEKRRSAYTRQVDKAADLSTSTDEFARMRDKVEMSESEVELDEEIRAAQVAADEAVDKKSRELQVEAELDKLKKLKKK